MGNSLAIEIHASESYTMAMVMEVMEYVGWQ